MDDIHQSSPLDRVIFVQRVAAFACKRTSTLIKLSHVNPTWQDTVHNYAKHLFKSLIDKDNYLTGRLMFFSACRADALWLVDSLADFWVIAKFPNALWEEIPHVGMTPMGFACRFGREDLCELLLSKTFPTRTYDRSGNNALHHACRSGRSIKIVKMLIENPSTKIAQVNSLEENGLMIACRYGFSNIVGLFLEKMSSEQRITNNKIDIEAENEMGATALMLAAMNLQHEFSENKKSDDHADVHDAVRCVRLLLEKGGANIAATNKSHEFNGRHFSAIHYAVLFGQANIVNTLLDHRSPCCRDCCCSRSVAAAALDKTGHTPLLMLCKFFQTIPHCKEIMSLLVSSVMSSTNNNNDSNNIEATTSSYRHCCSSKPVASSSSCLMNYCTRLVAPNAFLNSSQTISSLLGNDIGGTLRQIQDEDEKSALHYICSVNFSHHHDQQQQRQRQEENDENNNNSSDDNIKEPKKKKKKQTKASSLVEPYAARGTIHSKLLEQFVKAHEQDKADAPFLSSVEELSSCSNSSRSSGEREGRRCDGEAASSSSSSCSRLEFLSASSSSSCSRLEFLSASSSSSCSRLEFLSAFLNAITCSHNNDNSLELLQAVLHQKTRGKLQRTALHLVADAANEYASEFVTASSSSSSSSSRNTNSEVVTDSDDMDGKMSAEVVDTLIGVALTLLRAEERVFQANQNQTEVLCLKKMKDQYGHTPLDLLLGRHGGGRQIGFFAMTDDLRETNHRTASKTASLPARRCDDPDDDDDGLGGGVGVRYHQVMDKKAAARMAVGESRLIKEMRKLLA